MVDEHGCDGSRGPEGLGVEDSTAGRGTVQQHGQLLAELLGIDGAGLTGGVGEPRGEGHVVAGVLSHLTKAGLVTPEPKKRPKSSYIHFAASMPNETWQSDFTHYRLADGTDVEILTWLDDCTRYAIRVTAHHRVTTPIVLAEFRAAIKTAGIPASTLTDNGMVSPPCTSCREVPPPSA